MGHADLSLDQARDCPLCGGRPRATAFPFATVFDGSRFHYLECGKCQSVFVDPVPSAETFARMYAKADYHDHHYEGKEGGAYADSARLLKAHLPAGSSVLDYGCGTGAFLKALKVEGFVPFGVEFDREAAQFAGANAGCETAPVDTFFAESTPRKFQAIHLGDVLEHLPDPVDTLRKLLNHLDQNGLVFAEGPLEINASLVYWAARAFGTAKHRVRPQHVGAHAPTHLFRVGARQQRDLFMRVDPRLSVLHWDVYETGWPYANGGLPKQAIAHAAVRLSRLGVPGLTFGNRFHCILALRSGAHDAGPAGV